MASDKVRSRASSDVWLRSLNGSLLRCHTPTSTPTSRASNVNLEALNGSIGTRWMRSRSTRPPVQGLLNAMPRGASTSPSERHTLHRRRHGRRAAVSSCQCATTPGGDDFRDGDRRPVSAPTTTLRRRRHLIQAGDNVRLVSARASRRAATSRSTAGFGDTGNVDHVGTTITVNGSLSVEPGRDRRPARRATRSLAADGPRGARCACSATLTACPAATTRSRSTTCRA